MAYRVVVSHSSKDRPWVEWIKGQTGPGVDLWLAEHDPRPGINLSAKVQGEIDRCHAVLVFVTEASQASNYVQQEIGWALRAKKPIIPVVQEGITGDQLAMLQGAEYISFDFNAPQAGRDELLSHLRASAAKKAATDAQLQTALLLVGALLVIGVVTYSTGPGVA